MARCCLQPAIWIYTTSLDSIVSGQRLKAFDYRALRPNLLGDALSLNALEQADGLSVWVAQAGGTVSMQAQARFDDRADATS